MSAWGKGGWKGGGKYTKKPQVPKQPKPTGQPTPQQPQQPPPQQPPPQQPPPSQQTRPQYSPPIVPLKRWSMQEKVMTKGWDVVPHIPNTPHYDPSKPYLSHVFDQTKSIKSMDGVVADVTKTRIANMRAFTTPYEKAAHLYGDLHDIDNVASANEGLINSMLYSFESNGNPISNEELSLSFKSLRADVNAQIELTKFLRGDPHDFTKLDPQVRHIVEQLGDNYKLVKTWHAREIRGFGVPLQDLREYGHVPQPFSLDKLMYHGEGAFKAFMKDRINWAITQNRSDTPNVPVDRDKFIDRLWESFMKQEINAFTGAGGGGGGVNLQERTIHFKDTKAYMEYMQRYGTSDNILDTIVQEMRSLARSHAMINKFGPNPQETVSALLLELEREPQDSMNGEIVRKGARNMANALFGGSGAEDYIGKWWYVPSAARVYNSVNSIGINLATKNNIIYELISTPMMLQYLGQFYGVTGASADALFGALNETFNALRDIITAKDLTPEQEDFLNLLGLRYDLGRQFMPHRISEGERWEAPLWAREVNNAISNLKGTDALYEHNRQVSGIVFQFLLGKEVKRNKDWGDLTPRFRGLLEAGGITPDDWFVLRTMGSNILLDYGQLSTLFGMDHPTFNRLKPSLLSPTFGYRKALISQDRQLESIMYKLMVVQVNMLNRAQEAGHFMSTGALGGASASSRSFGGHMYRHFFSFRGYAVDKVARSLATFDLEGHGPGGARFARYVAERLSIGALVASFRWLLTGRKPEITDLESLAKFLGDAMGRGDVFPFSLIAEVFSDYYHTAGNSLAANLAQSSSRIAGPGISYAMQKSINAINLATNAANGDSAKAFREMRRLNPLGDWLPTDFIFNRLLLDPMFKAIDPDGAYELWSNEIKNNNKQNFRYFVEPGGMTGDIKGQTGIQTELSNARRDISKAKKAGEEHPLQPIKEKLDAERRELRRQMHWAGDDNQILINKMRLIDATWQLAVATYYRGNKPKNISLGQMDRAHKRAAEGYEDALRSERGQYQDMLKRRELQKQADKLLKDIERMQSKESKLAAQIEKESSREKGSDKLGELRGQRSDLKREIKRSIEELKGLRSELYGDNSANP